MAENTNTRRKGVVLAPILRQHYRCINEEERMQYAEMFPDVEWYYLDDPLPVQADTGYPDREALCDRYVKFINECEAECVLGSTNDDSAMVHAYVSENCPRINGPSMESVILANHKAYTREHVIPDELNLKFCPIDLDSETPIDIDGIMGKLGLPLILKPACEAGSTLVQVVNNKDDFEQALAVYNDLHRGSYYEKYGKVLMGYEDKYPLCKARTILAEEFVDIVKEHCSIVTVEIGACNGKAIPWVICDNVYWKKDPTCFLACATPPVMSEELQGNIWEQAIKTMKMMMDKGFNNSLINIEMFVWPSGKTKIMEINPRLAYQCTPLYTFIYEGGDNVIAMVNMQLGKEVKTPQNKHKLGIAGAPQYALNNYIATSLGGKASEIYNYQKAQEFEAANKHRRWDLRLIDGERELLADVQPFFCFGWTYCCGGSFKDCMSEIRAVSQSVFVNKEHHNSLWDDSYDWPQYYEERVAHYKQGSKPTASAN